jgi:hypothetical protein
LKNILKSCLAKNERFISKDPMTTERRVENG